MNSLSSFTAYASVPAQNAKIRFGKTPEQSIPQRQAQSAEAQDGYTVIEMVAPRAQAVQTRAEERTHHKRWYQQPGNIISGVSAASGLGILGYGVKASLSKPLLAAGAALIGIGAMIQFVKRCCRGSDPVPTTPIIITDGGGGADCGDALAACGGAVVECLGGMLGGL